MEMPFGQQRRPKSSTKRERAQAKFEVDVLAYYVDALAKSHLAPRKRLVSQKRPKKGQEQEPQDPTESLRDPFPEARSYTNVA